MLRGRFEQLVAEALDSLPPEIAERMENVESLSKPTRRGASWQRGGCPGGIPSSGSTRASR